MTNPTIIEDDKIKNISMENFGQPRLIIDCNDIQQCDRRKEMIFQSLRLMELVEETCNGKNGVCASILQSLLDEAKK